MLALVSGRYPRGPGEVAVTSGVAARFGLRTGGSWTLGGRVLRVTGQVENPANLRDQFALVAPGQLADPGGVTVLDVPVHRLGLNYYRVGQSRQLSNEVSYAMSPHVDAALFTILTHDIPGLEVQDTDGEWIEVPVPEEAWFVFNGLYLERWTNGAYRGAPHRVAPTTRERMSLQYKHRPSYGTVISPLEQFTSESNPPKFNPYDTGSEYLSILRSILS